MKNVKKNSKNVFPRNPYCKSGEITLTAKTDTCEEKLVISEVTTKLHSDCLDSRPVCKLLIFARTRAVRDAVAMAITCLLIACAVQSCARAKKNIHSINDHDFFSYISTEAREKCLERKKNHIEN